MARRRPLLSGQALVGPVQPLHVRCGDFPMAFYGSRGFNRFETSTLGLVGHLAASMKFAITNQAEKSELKMKFYLTLGVGK